MAKMILTLEGKHFQRQYLLYIVEITHGNDKYYYVGQTGDNNYITARPAFRRLAGHLEDVGRSTQNQIYRYLAVEILGISEAARKDSTFDEKIKQAVEDYLVGSTVKMYVYSLQPFIPDIEHSQHLKIVRKVTLFEKIVIGLLLTHSKTIANKNVALPPEDAECPYPQVLNQIVADFKLNKQNDVSGTSANTAQKVRALWHSSNSCFEKTSLTLEKLGEISCQADKLNKEEAVTKFVIIIDQCENGLSIVECPSIPGCVSQGKTDKKPQKILKFNCCDT